MPGVSLIYMPFWEKITQEKLLIVFVFLDLFIIGFLIAFWGFDKFKPQIKNTEERIENPIAKATPSDVTAEKGVFTTVLLGSGGAGHDGGGLTDSIIVVNINSNTKKALLVSVPRDLWVPGGHKINAVANNNGIDAIRGVVQNITGLETDYYASISFSEYITLIDKLGGIDIEVPNSFQDDFYPIKGEENNVCGHTEEEIFVFKNKYSGFDLEKQFTCRYEKLKFDKGPAHLDGTTALKFVRSRHGDSDFGRSQRQFAVLKGIFNKLLSLDALNNSISILDSLLRLVKTNLTPGEIKSILAVLGNTGEYQVQTLQLSTENVLKEGFSADRQYILTPKAGNYNYQEIQKFISGNINP